MAVNRAVRWVQPERNRALSRLGAALLVPAAQVGELRVQRGEFVQSALLLRRRPRGHWRLRIGAGEKEQEHRRNPESGSSEGRAGIHLS